MNNEILYILLPDYAAHEAVYLSQAISSGEFALKENRNTSIRLSLQHWSRSGPSADSGRCLIIHLETMPDDYFAIVLIGGFGWETPIADQVVPIVRQSH